MSSPGKHRTLTLHNPEVTIETGPGVRPSILITSGEGVLLLEIDEKTAREAIDAFRLTPSAGG